MLFRLPPVTIPGMANGERGPEKEYPATLYLRLLQEQRDFVEWLGDGNASEGVRLCIDLAREHPELLRDMRRPPSDRDAE